MLQPALLAKTLEQMSLCYTNLTSADFALSLMEGVSRVQVIRSD